MSYRGPYSFDRIAAGMTTNPQPWTPITDPPPPPVYGSKCRVEGCERHGFRVRLCDYHLAP
jgi:hypothetical protein